MKRFKVRVELLLTLVDAVFPSDSIILYFCHFQQLISQLFNQMTDTSPLPNFDTVGFVLLICDFQ